MYIKDIFSDALDCDDERLRQSKRSEVFSYFGNTSNPPDMMLKNGDAIEVKKIENEMSRLALNSLHPKSKLLASNPLLTNGCRNCEEWVERDLLYTVGVVSKKNRLSKLFFIYGTDYAADNEVYERLKTNISEGILETPNVELGKTKELGRVNKVDPLGITFLRIRGMWHIESPFKVFSDDYSTQNSNFEFVAIINTEKYYSFPKEDIIDLEKLVDGNFRISNIKIKDPNNPAKLKNAKLLQFNR